MKTQFYYEKIKSYLKEYKGKDSIKQYTESLLSCYVNEPTNPAFISALENSYRFFVAIAPLKDYNF